MRVNRSFDPNYIMGYLGSVDEIKYAITENDYVMRHNIALVLDTSASMEHVWLNEREKRIQVLTACVKRLMEKFGGPGFEVGLFVCSENGEFLEWPPSCIGSNMTDYVSEVLGINLGGNTNLGDGMREAYWYLNNCSAVSKKYMILLSDGETNCYTTMEDSSTGDFKLDQGDSIYTFKGTRALDYALEVAKMVTEKGITTYSIALTGNTPNQLETIATACNASPLENGKHYYQVRFAEEIYQICSKIRESLPQCIPVTITFNEVFPSGVEVLNVPEGLKITKQADNRCCVKGNINTLFVKDELTGIYNFKPWDGAIKVKYTSNGIKHFVGPSVSYINPSEKLILGEMDIPLIISVM